MSDYCGYITRIKNLKPLPNSDTLMIGQCFDDNVIVDNTYTDNELVIYFMAGTQLGPEFCAENNLIRRLDENGKNVGGYLEKSRAVKAINLRKSKSDGLALKLDSLSRFIPDPSVLREGERIEVLYGIVIAQKYIPKVYERHGNGAGAKSKAPKEPKEKCPLFAEHVETSHLDKALMNFHCGDIVQITIKMDGTSQRTAYLPIIKKKPRTWIDKLFRRKAKEYVEYGYVSGTRRVVLNSYDGGYFGNNEFRRHMAEKFEGLLHKNEEVYYEIVGYTGTNGTPIRPTVDNKKLKDKEFVQKYGAVSEFSYGCDPSGGYNEADVTEVVCADTGEEIQMVKVKPLDPPKPCCRLFVYRMTMTNEDGDIVEYSPEQIKMRCQDIGVEYVPECETFRIPDDCEDPGAYVLEKAKQYYDGPDPIGKTHIREGVVVRIVNRRKFSAYKLKNHNYKVLAGIAMDQLVESGEINNLSADAIEEM